MENNDLDKLVGIRALMSECFFLYDKLEQENAEIDIKNNLKKKEIEKEKKIVIDLNKKCNKPINMQSEEEFTQMQLNTRRRKHEKLLEYHTKDYFESKNFKPSKENFDFDDYKYYAFIGLIIGVILGIIVAVTTYWSEFWRTTFLFKWFFDWYEKPMINGTPWLYKIIFYYFLVVVRFVVYLLIICLFLIIIIDLSILIGYFCYLKISYVINMKKYKKKINELVKEDIKNVKYQNEIIKQKNEKIDEYNNSLQKRIKKEYKKYVIMKNNLINDQNNDKLELQKLSNSLPDVKKQINEKYKLLVNEHKKNIKIKMIEIKEVFNELDNYCRDFINISDLKYIDVLIYYISTYRASSLKEALNLLDNDLKFNLTLETINKMNRDISIQLQNCINSAIKYMDTSINELNNKLDEMDINNNNFSNTLLELQDNLNNKIQNIVKENKNTKQLIYNNMSLISALQSQVNTSSEQMMNKMNLIRRDIIWKI
ncbi:MAG: hypothetical protein ACI35W_00490 [Anaeroplasmataceae bacterium]